MQHFLLLLLLLTFNTLTTVPALLLPYIQNGATCSNSSIPGCICDDVYFDQFHQLNQGCVSNTEDLLETCCTRKDITTLVFTSPQRLSALEGTSITQGSSVGTLQSSVRNLWTANIEKNSFNAIANDQVVQENGPNAHILWTYVIDSQTINAAAGVTVTQTGGVITGTLHTALIGATTEIVIRSAVGITFDKTTSPLNINNNAASIAIDAMTGTLTSVPVPHAVGLLYTDMATTWTVQVSTTEWVITFKSTQDITKSAGVAVTQGLSSGTLKTALNGAETKTVIVRCDSGVTFATGATINVGGIPVPSGNIATVVNRLTSIPLRTSILQNNGYKIFTYTIASQTINANKNVVVTQSMWTVAITAQAITESAGVTVTQTTGSGTITGRLKTALTGSTTEILIETVSSVTFTTTASLVIGSITVESGNVNTVTNSVIASGTLEEALSGSSTKIVIRTALTGATFDKTSSALNINNGASFVITTNFQGALTMVATPHAIGHVASSTITNGTPSTVLSIQTANNVVLDTTTALQMLSSSEWTGTLVPANDLFNEWTLIIAAQGITQSSGAVVSQNEWTISIDSQTITESSGASVTQGSSVGVLKTQLTGANMNTIVVVANHGVTFVSGVQVVIDVEGTPSTILLGNVNTAENTVLVSGKLKTNLQNEWTLAIAAQGITESAGVTVTQGSSTGTLKTALSNEWTLAVLNTPTIAETAGVTVSQGDVAKGTLKTTLSGDATSVVIETASGVTILANADVTVGSTVLVHANINTATNNGATTQIIVQAAAGISFVTTADLVIGSTTVALANVNTATNSVLATGTLKTALSGGTTSSVVIETAAGVTFVTTANVMIGSTPLLLANINTATNTPTTSLIVETAASVTLITTSDIVIGSTTILHTNLNTVTKTKSREIGCWLFEFSGLFLSHSDFLISEKDKAKIEEKNSGDRIDGTVDGEWPIENVFVGKKEPDLADALIKANILKKYSSRTPDSSKTVYFFRVNEEIFKETAGGVLSGTLDSASSKCLQPPSDSNPVKWFVSHVADSNAFILVVDGYRRKDTECVLKTQSKPIETRSNNEIIDTCGKQVQFLFESSSWQKKLPPCPLCAVGEYGDVLFESCRLCPPGQYSEFAGSATCSNCSKGDYNEVAGQSVCRSCPKGTYSLEIGADKNPCIDCPPGAVCSGGSNMETNVLMSVPQLASKDGKNVHVSYWRDPLILNTTGKASSCFYECVEPRSCLGTLSCNDDEKGTGKICNEWRRLLLSYSPFVNGTINEEGTFIFQKKKLSTKNWNDELNIFMNYTELIYGNIACKETSSIGEAYCIVTRLKEGCAKGYHGITCSGCLPGYSRSGPTMTQCAKCAETSAAIAYVIFAVIIALMLYAFLIIKTLKGYGNLPREGIIMRVISSNVLILSLFKDLEVQWPSEVKSFMSSGSVAGDPVSLLNIECLAQAEGIPYIIMKAITALSMPVIFFVLLGIVFGTQYLLSKRHFQASTIKNVKNGERRTDIFATSLTAAMANRFNKKLTKNKKNGDDEDNEVYAGEDHDGLVSMKNVVDPITMFKGSLVVMLYMLYPSLVKNTFGGIECVQHKQMGNTDQCPDLLRTEQQYFFRDQSVQCYNDEHYLYLYAIFLPALLFYVIMVPVFFFFQLKKHKGFIFAGPTLHRVTWGFITSGYEIKTYFWELVILARKSMLVFIMVFVRPMGPIMTALCCLAVLVIFLAAHSQWLPFVDYHVDLLEKASLVSNILMILLGVMFNFASRTQSHVITILIFLINIMFYGTAIFMYVGSKLAHKRREKQFQQKQKDRKEARLAAEGQTKVMPISNASDVSQLTELQLAPTKTTTLTEKEKDGIKSWAD